MNNKTFLSILLILSNCLYISAQEISDEDLAIAYQMKKNFPKEETGIAYAEEYYEFSRSKNEDNIPVVAVLRTSYSDLIAMKDKSSMIQLEYYNQFAELKKYHLLLKAKDKYKLFAKKGIDQSATGEDIFFDDNRYQAYQIPFLTLGSAARIESEKFYKDLKYLPRIFFHTPYPVQKKVIRFALPKWLQIDFKEINFTGYKINKSTEPNGDKIIYTYTVEKLEPYFKDKNAPGAAFIYPHILIVLKSFETEGNQKASFSSTADLYKWYHYLYKKCNNDFSVIKNQVAELTKNCKTEIDKIKSIFYWVQDNIRYIAFEDGLAGFVPSTIQEVLKNKYGDCKGMANLLTEMLKEAGFKARFTWIGTNHIPYNHSTAVMCVDNHAISTLYLNGKEFFLDATEKYVPFGEHAYRIQGKEALIENGDQYDLKTVPLSDKGFNKISLKANFTLSNDNVLKGHIKVTFTGNERTEFHQIYQDLPSDKRKEFLQHLLEFGNTNLATNNVKTSDLSNRDIPVVIEGDIDLTNNITKVGNDLFASIDFFPRELDNYLPDDKRKTDFEFNSSYVLEDEIELIAPINYTFKDLPNGLNISQKDFSFVADYTVKANSIVLKKYLNLATGKVLKSDFPLWKEMINKMKEFNSYQITISKK